MVMTANQARMEADGYTVNQAGMEADVYAVNQARMEAVYRQAEPAQRIDTTPEIFS